MPSVYAGLGFGFWAYGVWDFSLWVGLMFRVDVVGFSNLVSWVPGLGLASRVSCFGLGMYIQEAGW